MGFVILFDWKRKGNQADPRMRAASKKRGIEITSISRPIRPSDFRDFDLIVAMDEQNRGRIFVNSGIYVWLKMGVFVNILNFVE